MHTREEAGMDQPEEQKGRHRILPRQKEEMGQRTMGDWRLWISALFRVWSCSSQAEEDLGVRAEGAAAVVVVVVVVVWVVAVVALLEVAVVVVLWRHELENSYPIGRSLNGWVECCVVSRSRPNRVDERTIVQVERCMVEPEEQRSEKGLWDDLRGQYEEVARPWTRPRNDQPYLSS
jgi:hypothetical protein